MVTQTVTVRRMRNTENRMKMKQKKAGNLVDFV